MSRLRCPACGVAVTMLKQIGGVTDGVREYRVAPCDHRVTPVSPCWPDGTDALVSAEPAVVTNARLR